MKTTLAGKVVPGYGVASGRGEDKRYPEGTIRLQAPYFKSRGLDLQDHYMGTINVDISPRSFQVVKPAYFFDQVDWSPHIPPENFYFFDADLVHLAMSYSGYIYMPDPETKPEHHQKPNIMELIMPEISGLKYGDSVELEINPKQIAIL